MKTFFEKTMAAVLVLGVMQVAYAEMEPLGDETMSNVKGQNGGMSLSGDVSFNANGSGPLRDGGSRIAAQLSEGGGFFVLDDLQGTFAFEGLTIQTRLIDGSDSGFGGDAGNFNRTVIEIGMPETARFENFNYTIATSTTAGPEETGFQQTKRISVEMDGAVTLDGNMLIFPLDQ